MPSYLLALKDHNGSHIADLPDAQLDSVEWALSDIGSVNFTMKQTDARVTLPILRRHEVYVYIDGWPDATVVPWAGPILTEDGNDQNVAFAGNSLEHYFGERYIDFSSLYFDGTTVDADGTVHKAPKNFSGYPQVFIGWTIVQYAQGQVVQNGMVARPFKDMRITADPNLPTGTKKRLRRYNRADHQNNLDMLKEFPGLVDYTTGQPNGFDWMVQANTDGSRWWRAWEPLRGAGKSLYTLEYGRNITSYTVKGDTTNFAARAICTGGSDGNTKMENEYNDFTTAAAYGEAMAVISDGGQMDPTELGAKARQYVLDRNHTILEPTVNSVRVPVDFLGRLQPGDSVPLVIKNGRHNIQQWRRITKIKWTVRPNTIDLTFQPLLPNQGDG